MNRSCRLFLPLLLCSLILLLPQALAATPPADPIEPPPETAMLRVAHLSPNASEANVVLTREDETPAPSLEGIEELGYGEISDYYELPSGAYTVTLTAADDEDSVTVTETINLRADGYHTLAVLGLVLAGLDDEEVEEGGFFDWLTGLFAGERARDRDVLGLHAALFNDDLDGAFASDEARLRLVHAAPGLGDVDLVSAAERGVIIGRLSFGDASGYQNTTRVADLEIHPAESRAVLVDLSDEEISPGMVTTVFLIGTPVVEIPHEVLVVSDTPRVPPLEPVADPAVDPVVTPPADPAPPPADPAVAPPADPAAPADEEEIDEEAEEAEEVEETEEVEEEVSEETVAVSLVDGAIEMPTTLSAGLVTFEITNDGSVAHSFEIEGEGLEEELDEALEPGETATLTVELQAGSYRVYCPVGDHAEEGMELEVEVTAD